MSVRNRALLATLVGVYLYSWFTATAVMLGLHVVGIGLFVITYERFGKPLDELE